jgi:7-keto-8-aminopelargonate synthetase-like enzyme
MGYPEKKKKKKRKNRKKEKRGYEEAKRLLKNNHTLFAFCRTSTILLLCSNKFLSMTSDTKGCMHQVSWELLISLC